MGADFQIRIGVDGRQAATGIDFITRQFTTLGTKLGGFAAGYLSAGFLASQARGAIEWASSLNDLSAGLGISTQALQEWMFAATQAGGKQEDIEAFFRKLAETRAQALGNPTGAQAQTFHEFGVSLADLQKLRLEDIARKVAQIFEVGDPQKLIAPLKIIGGKGAAGLIPAFSEGISQAAAEAQRLGLVLDEEVIAALDSMGDRLDRLSLRSKGFFAQMLAGAEDLGQSLRARLADWSVFLAVITREGFTGTAEGGPATFGELLDRTKAEVEQVRKSREAILGEEAEKDRQWRELRRSVLQGGDTETQTDKIKEEHRTASFARHNADTLARIGLFRGGVQDQSVVLLRQQVTHLQRVVAKLDLLHLDLTNENLA
jgi:hypothetical protein